MQQDIVWVEYTWYDGHTEEIPVPRDVHEWNVAKAKGQQGQAQDKPETPRDQH
jgi:hypothetical protein